MSTARKSIPFLLLVLAALMLSGCTQPGGSVCPPAGFPQPPGCAGGPSIPAGGIPGVGVPGATVVPGAGPARNDFGCFPPSCSMIPDKRGAFICEQFRSGRDTFYWPADCSVMPLSCPQLCEAEKKRYHDLGTINWENGIKDNVNWWREPYTKVFVFGSVNQGYEALGADSRAWGAQAIKDSDTQMEADGNHYFNLSFIDRASYGNVQIQNKTGPIFLPRSEAETPESLRPALRRDLEGNLVPGEIPVGSSAAVKAYQWVVFNGFVPALRDANIALFEREIDLGADGIILDDAGVVPKTIDLATYFDNYTIDAFGEYLRANLSAQRWGELGAVADGFDYGAYLRSKGYTSTSFSKPDWASIPLAKEFRRFISAQNEAAIRKIFSDVRQYAASKGRRITVTANAQDAPFEDALDYLTHEIGFVTTDLDRPAYVPYANRGKMAQAIGKPQLNLMVAATYNVLSRLAKRDPQTYYDVYRLAVMESYATKGSHILLRATLISPVDFPDEVSVLKATADASDILAINTSYGFMRMHKEYFRDYGQSDAKVAYLYDYASTARMWVEDDSYGHYNEALALGNALYRAGFDFDVLAPGADLSQYTVVAVPQIDRLTDADADALLRFAQNGGLVVLSGRPAGKLADVPAGPVGKGELRVVTSTPESISQAALEAARAKARPIQTSANLSAISYNDGHGDYVVHLFALEPGAGPNGIGFAPKSNVKVDLPFPTEGLKAYYATLENPQLQPLDTANIVLPQIRTYGLLVLKKG